MAKPSRALALSCKNGRTEIPTNIIALLLQETASFGSSWRRDAIGRALLLLASAFLEEEYTKKGSEEEGKRERERGECKKQELPITKPIAFSLIDFFG